MGVFAGTERQCTEDEHDDQDDSQTSEFGIKSVEYPELGWLEILPGAPGRERRETYIVLESLDRAFERIRRGEVPPEQPWLAKGSDPKRKLRKKKSSQV